MKALEQTVSVSIHSEAGTRPNNEDKVGYYAAPDGSGVLLALADGMGGHACGEIASQRAMDVLLKMFEKYQFSDVEKLMQDAIYTAHERIQRDAAQDEHKEGMGTTIVAAVLLQNEVVVGHVGDSRALQFRLPYVRRLTRDHLYAIDVLDVEESQAKHHAQGNVLSQALGIAGEIKPTLNRFDACPGDIIVLCSDGVSECVIEPHMAQLLEGAFLPQSAANIVRAALANGSRDNCSVVAAQFP